MDMCMYTIIGVIFALLAIEYITIVIGTIDVIVAGIKLLLNHIDLGEYLRTAIYAILIVTVVYFLVGSSIDPYLL